METRKESLSSLKVCRFCLTENEPLTSIYEKNRIPRKSVNLPLKILSCISMEVFPSDKMPSLICTRCKLFMELFYEYKKICRQADENILEYVQNGYELDALPWPASLNKVLRGLSKSKSSSEVKLVKTVVESGAMVQVSTQDSGTDVEDDENVYSVKITDDSEEGYKNACIKVVTGSEKQTEVKGKPGRQSRKDSEVTDNVCDKTFGTKVCDTVVGTEEKRWPCEDCDCSYPLRQMLQIHRVQQHQVRTELCDQCDAKFFTENDLVVHQLRHMNRMLFQCVVCDKRFKRLLLLKRHEKLVHWDSTQQSCPSCPATFISFEELETHQRKHKRFPHRPFICLLCDKTFTEEERLKRHNNMAHLRQLAFYCEYCPLHFSSVSKLAKHVRSHADGRMYPCKFCEKSFTKAHHYTRHVRNKHRNRRGPFGDQDQFRCEQCEDNFASQDDLIYHSAIHATQNLTCPLCQEKFQDVDAVTTHIKSHVNGMEFMCEFCELIFTCNEKLNNHITKAHEHEMKNEDLDLDESSTDIQALDDDEDDTGINVKEEDGQMVVEINKADEFMISNYKGDYVEKMDITNSEESESEVTYLETAPGKTESTIVKNSTSKVTATAGTKVPVTAKPADTNDSQTATILRKAEDIKRKVNQQKPSEPVPKVTKAESTTPVGASDKSLRLLEKELQELKRTNSRETVKAPAKSIETIRNRRPQIHTSTPKPKPVEEKKPHPVVTKPPLVEKKLPERRVPTKENKELKETIEAKNNNTSVKENTEKETKEKEVPKLQVSVKTEVTETSNTDETVRRSTRPSKVKDYAKMVRDSSHESDTTDDGTDDEDQEEKVKDRTKSPESRPKTRRGSIKAPPAPKAAAAGGGPAPATRKRGRPRKCVKVTQSVQAKIMKKNPVEDTDSEKSNKSEESMDKDSGSAAESGEGSTKTPKEEVTPGNIMVSPSGHTLKKVPIKALPPGVKPLPLPVNARTVTGQVCEMQIGKKLVKVQKIVMTKAEVEAMAKKGLVEMKDGTMVLKQGIKIPTSDPAALKSTLVGDKVSDTTKESPSKKEKATPTRCDLDHDV